jgi:ribose/xylose/arabinose/galactoside ABC-type transport system permease subunit
MEAKNNLPGRLQTMRIARVLRTYGIILVILSIVIIGSIISPYFLQVGNLMNISKQAAMLGFLALGMTLVIASGGIDLSVGSVVALSNILVVGISRTMPTILGAYIALFSGVVVGLISGFLINRLGFQPFIATLSTMVLARGVGMIYSGSQSISGTLPEEFHLLFEADVVGVPFPTILFLAAMFLIALFVRYSRLGREIYHVGGNEEAARSSGVNVIRVKYVVYAISGLLAAFAGLLLSARMHAGDPVKSGVGWELDAIAAVVIGGASLKGGIGNVFFTTGGVLITAFLYNIFNLLSVNTYWQRVIIGVVICISVWSQKGKK